MSTSIVPVICSPLAVLTFSDLMLSAGMFSTMAAALLTAFAFGSAVNAVAGRQRDSPCGPAVCSAGISKVAKPSARLLHPEAGYAI